MHSDPGFWARFWAGRYTGGSSNHEGPMAKPNYSFEKRQRELAKKKKKDEKDAKKRAERDATRSDTPATPDAAE